VTVALLAALAVVVGIGVAAGALRRRVGNERSSVREYQHTIDTLRHLSDRRTAAESSVRPAASARTSRPSNEATSESAAGAAKLNRAANGTGAGTAASTRSGNGSRRGTRSRRTTLLASTAGEGRAPVLADRSGPPTVSMRVDAPEEIEHDEPPAPTGRHGEPGNGAAPDGPGPAQRITAADAVRELAAARNLHGPRPARPSMPSTQRPDRRPIVWTVVAVIVIGAVTGVALATGPSRSAKPSAASTHQTTPAVHSSVPPTTRSASHKHSSSSASSSKGASGGLDPVTSSSTAATYQAPSTPYNLTLAATGPCWVEATNSSGQVLWTGTMHAGDSQSVPGTSQMLVRLGNALNVTLAVSGRPVHLPPGYSPTIDLTFLA
jgi:cytoskeletal protein RodZ